MGGGGALSDQHATAIDRSKLEYVKKQHWRYEDTDYVLGYIPSECDKCGDEIGEQEAGYIVDGPRSAGDGDLGELCFWCGNEVTGFAD